ncbi:MAG: DUF4886 domain-containing protein, partial [Ruminococcaceae bacterium]|nr:DUF4886 domain-containing protein [Oscillospiraceae bacterium]
MKFLKKSLCALLAVCMIFCGNTAVFAGEWGDNINAAEIIEQEEISRHLKIFGDVEYMYMPSSDPDSGNDEEIWYALTPCDQFKAGSIWYDRQIAAEAGFTVSFDYRMGGAGKFGFEEGELLGISFVEEIDFNDSNAVNYFAPYSYKVEIDPYRNTGDPLGGHIAIVQGMATRHLAYELRDDLVGNWHTVKVEYIPGNMKVYFDDDLLINENDIFLSDDIYMGINAYTTYPANEHLVKNVYVTGIISNGTEFTDDNDPIIIIPGIMGSRLFTSNTVFDNSTLVWDPPTETLGDAWDIHWLNERMDLNGNTQLYVRPCENQNDKNSGTVAEYGREYGSLDIYEELVDKLCANFPEREVYFFSYDWRLSNAVSANSLADFIDSLDAEKVDLVCHSMGGLVASQYFEDYGDEKTDTIITMGTPYEGAPKLINSVQNWDVLGTGAFGKNSIKDAFLAIFGGMTKEIKSSFSGVAELTPTENYIKRFPMWKDSAWPFGAGDYKLTYTEYANICKKIFDNFAQAQFVQNEILDESGFNLLLNYDKAYFLIGTGNKTITSVKFQYSNNDVDERLYESDLSYDNLGDGTVPYYSASVCDKIKYLDENRWFEINAEHNGMTSKNRVIRWVTEVLKYGVSDEKDDPLAKREYTTIRIACPVDVTVTNGEETLSSANGSLSTGASFGRLDIIGENDEIKMLCIDTSDEYDITINGMDSGTMDYAIRFFDEDGNQLDERIFEKVPVTENTVIKTNSAPEENTLLQVDTNGDGASDEIWSAGKGDWVTADENARIPIESIGFEKNTIKINAGEQFDLAAKVYPENANDGVGFKYSSSDEAVAKVDENGTVSAIAAGTATIKAIATNGMEAEIEVKVKNPDWMIEDGEFKLLLIGNSYTEDASCCGQGMPNSMLFDIIQAMLGEDIKVTVGTIINGGKGINWHATQAEQGLKKYTLRVMSSDDTTWKAKGTVSAAEALAWTDWDAVSLQHYGLNVEKGEESVPYPEQTDEKFYKLEVASEFMLDHIAEYAPQAEAYFYFHWAQTSSITMNAALSKYNKMADYIPVVLDYAGTESGKQFKDIIPVGLSVQNARTTYLSLLSYNTTAYADGNLNLYTDAQIGLQRDGGHLSFNIGRYIAGLTFAETIIPEEIRAEGYVLPDIRVTESIGKLPKEYTEIAQKSVFAAVENWKNGSLEVTE